MTKYYPSLLYRLATIFLISILSLSSCSPIGLAIGAGASLVTATQTEKGLKNSADDLRIKAEINHHLFQRDHQLFGAVKVSVENGRVLITGSVKEPKERIEITKLSWKVSRVREVINETQVTNGSNIADQAKDLLINKALQAQLLIDQDVKFINYSVDTVNGTVYVFGVARDHVELNRVISHARNTNYVENVISYVTIKDK
jgi:osmotically-inducible protein OsmY